MGHITWSELFPNRTSVVIFFGYMSLFISQGILVTASQESDNGYSYNTVTVVLLTEVLKLLISVVLYKRDHTFSSLLTDVIKGRGVLLLYFVPSFLYCLYNNLAFVNLSAFDPTTYYLLLQFRVVITGILFQIIFKKYLNLKQWISLILLTLGCMIKQIDFGQTELTGVATTTNLSAAGISSGPLVSREQSTKSIGGGSTLSINAVFILVQAVCSCLAGVYNEYLLKNQGADVNIYVQNVFMYLDSIVCNVLLLLLQGDLLDAFTGASMKSIFRLNVILVMVNNAAIGIVTSFFLKYMNSILKTFASALELMFTAVLCYILFAIPIHINTVLAIGVVSFSIYLYSQSPVSNNKDTQLPRTHQDSQRLLSEHNQSDDENA